MNDAQSQNMPAAQDVDETLTHGDRDPFDQVAEEFAERCRKGESPSISEYEVRYPEFAPRIRKLLPTVALMEQLKRGAHGSQGGEPARSIPERLGEFRVLRELGRGGMGIVYEAVQEPLGRNVALKVIHHVHLDAKRLQRFRREAQAVAQLHHTNIVPIFGFGEHEGLPYYAMQYIRGDGLDTLLGTWRREGSPRAEERWRLVARVGVQAAEALQYAHEQGILHRDIKPANLLIDEHQAVWITDFGLAKLTGQDDLTASGDVIGTLRYLAPEALRGLTDGRSDVYSLGLTLYELLTLSPPFGELTPSELLRHVSEGQPTRPRRLDPAIPRDLETIVLKATAREPEHRYPTAGALAEDLRRFLEDRPIRAQRATPIERLWRWSRRNRTIAALTATAAGSLLLAAVVGWAGYVRSDRDRRRADANVALSLEVFGELFERLTANDNFLSPPLDPQGRRTSFLPGPEEGPPPPGQPGGRRPPPPPPDDGEGGPFAPQPPPSGDRPPRRPGDLPFTKDHRPRGGMPGPPRREISEEEAALLQTILTFYDRFARQNATNSRLQGEAAWAYRKVGALNTWLGHDEEAERAYTRAIAMFEDLIARYPDVPEYRFKLVETCDMADPWSADPATLQRLEPRLRRALTLIDELVAGSPENKDYAQAQQHVQAKLGTTLQLLDRDEEAEACYRRAIALQGELIERAPRTDRPLIDRAATRETLALLQLERGRQAEARALLDATAADLQTLALCESLPPPLASRFANLARAYERLGETQQAEEMTRRAAEVAARPTHAPQGHPGRGPGSRRMIEVFH
jgi:serine/threonine protein kinase/tetratricopeptide (TPR) repeat protein